MRIENDAAVKHKIHTKHVGGAVPAAVYRSLIKQAVLMTFKSEAVGMPCVVTVLITDDKGIREYNKKHRGIDKATDVLSFPMQNYSQPGWSGLTEPDVDMDTQTVPLGDIIISTTTIKRNARRYKHSFEKETSRMIFHSALHLLGYDHSEEMMRKENELMRAMGYLVK